MAKQPKNVIESIHPVGRYAVGVRWGDHHDSIYPFETLRRVCPCETCARAEAVKRVPRDEERRLEGVRRIGEASVMFHWADGHETLLLVEELREVCGCAACKGEPDYPITGQ